MFWAKSYQALITFKGKPNSGRLGCDLVAKQHPDLRRGRLMIRMHLLISLQVWGRFRVLRPKSGEVRADVAGRETRERSAIFRVRPCGCAFFRIWSPQNGIGLPFGFPLTPSRPQEKEKRVASKQTHVASHFSALFLCCSGVRPLQQVPLRFVGEFAMLISQRSNMCRRPRDSGLRWCPLQAASCLA